MTRSELLRLLLAQARSQGFEFRRWYVSRLSRPWTGSEEAVTTLSSERRYYALLFSHEFATTFWKAGTKMMLQMPSQSFSRVRADGTIATVERKGHLRRMTRNDAWQFHLREMALHEEPLRYMRKFLRVEDELDHAEPLPAEKPIVIVDEEDLLSDED